MTNKKFIYVGLATLVVAVIGVSYLIPGDSLQGAFNFGGKNKTKNPTTEQYQTVFNGSGATPTGNMMRLLENSSYEGITYAGFDAIGVWYIASDDGKACDTWEFQIVDMNGPVDWDDTFDEIRLNVHQGDDIYTQIASGEYISPISGGTFNANDFRMDKGEAYLFQLYGNYSELADISPIENDTYVYLSEACAEDSSGTKYRWTDEDTYGENAYFSDKNTGVGYGIKGFMELSTLTKNDEYKYEYEFEEYTE